jgi:transposase
MSNCTSLAGAGGAVVAKGHQIHRHLLNVLTFFAHRITNTVLEGLNSRIQTIKNMAYGRCAKS